MIKHKLDLETVSEIWNRPKYAGGSVTSANRPKARGGSWTDTVRVTDKGAENPQGVNYYFDKDGNIVNSVNGRKGQIKLDETVITPLQRYTVDKNGNKTIGFDPLRVFRNDKPLETIYPEFDLLSMGTGSSAAKTTTKAIADTYKPAFNLNGIFESNWYKSLVSSYGRDKADEVVEVISNPKFRKYFFGNNEDKAKEAIDKFVRQRDIVNKVAGDINKGKGAISGSAAIAHEGTLNRTGAAMHDLDLNAYMKNATKTTKNYRPKGQFEKKGEYIKEVAPELDDTQRLFDSPILSEITSQFPEQFAQPIFVTNRSKLRNKLGQLHNLYNKYFPNAVSNPFPSNYETGVFNLTGLKNTTDTGATRTLMTRINGEPIDIFLSDSFIPTNGKYETAETVFKWKDSFIKEKLARGKKPRAKDIADKENYKPFSESNPVIKEDGTSQYAPFSFKESSLVSSEGYPILSPVETYPGSGKFIPAFMNYKGEFYSPFTIK